MIKLLVSIAYLALGTLLSAQQVPIDALIRNVAAQRGFDDSVPYHNTVVQIRTLAASSHEARKALAAQLLDEQADMNVRWMVVEVLPAVVTGDSEELKEVEDFALRSTFFRIDLMRGLDPISSPERMEQMLLAALTDPKQTSMYFVLDLVPDRATKILLHAASERMKIEQGDLFMEDLASFGKLAQPDRPEVLDVLMLHLRNAKFDLVRWKAAEALKAAATVPEVRTALENCAANDVDGPARGTCLESLSGFTTDPKVRAAFTSALKDKYDGVRARAVKELKPVADRHEDVRHALSAYLVETAASPADCALGADALELEIGQQGVLDAYLTALKNPKACPELIWPLGLSSYSGERGEAAILTAFHHENSAVRARAVEAKQNQIFDTPIRTEILDLLASEKDPEVRAKILDNLWIRRADMPDINQALTHSATADPSPVARAAAVKQLHVDWGFEKETQEQDMKLVLSAMGDPAPEVRDAAREQLDFLYSFSIYMEQEHGAKLNGPKSADGRTVVQKLLKNGTKLQKVEAAKIVAKYDPQFLLARLK